MNLLLVQALHVIKEMPHIQFEHMFSPLPKKRNTQIFIVQKIIVNILVKKIESWITVSYCWLVNVVNDYPSYFLSGIIITWLKVLLFIMFTH